MPSAQKIAYRIAEACSDCCTSYDLLQDGKLVSSTIARSGMNETSAGLNELQQQIVIDREMALRDSIWAIRESRRLVAAIDAMQNSGRLSV